MKRARFMIAIAALAHASAVWADGGIVAWSGERLNQRAAVIVSPAAMRVGLVEFVWIGAHREGAVVIATNSAGQRLDCPLREGATVEGGGTELRAALELPSEGSWTIEVDPDGEGTAASAVFSLEVGPPLPAWSAVWPYLFAWIPMVAIGLFAARRSHRAPKV